VIELKKTLHFVSHQRSCFLIFDLTEEDQTKIVLTELVQKDRAISYNELKFISDIGSGGHSQILTIS
jgi:hypothetical protein